MQNSSNTLFSEAEWQSAGGLLTLQSICNQPRLWREGFALIQQHRAEIERFWQQLADEPRNIILCGAGSSLSAARVAAQWIRQQTGKSIQVLASTDIVVKPELYLENKPTLLVSVTSSGSTPESTAVFELAERLIDDCYHLIVANDP
ncbi:MAG: silent information regulator protein Sir2, partial [Hafnia sp.]